MLTQVTSAMLTQEGGTGSMLSMILPFVLLIAVFYFLLIRPENKKKKAAAKMRSELAVGDEITTIGGIVGTICAGKEDTCAWNSPSGRFPPRAPRPRKTARARPRIPRTRSNTKRPPGICSSRNVAREGVFMRKTEEDQAAKLLRYGVGIVLGGAAALAVCLLFLLAASVLISRGLLADGLTYQLSIVGCVVGAFAGGMLAVRRCGRRTLIVGLCTGAVLFLLLLTVGVLFFETMSVEQGGIGLLCGGLCGGAAAGLLGGGKRSGGKKKRRK